MRKFTINLFFMFIIVFTPFIITNADNSAYRINTVSSNFTYNFRAGDHVKLAKNSELCGHILYFYTERLQVLTLTPATKVNNKSPSFYE